MIGERLKELRGKRSQEEVATNIGISRARLSHYETERSEPDSEILKKLADFYNVSTDYLLTGKKLDESISVAGQEITLTPDELKVFEELKKHPILFNDLASDPEKKIKELIKLQKAKKLLLEEDEEYGKGFGDLED